MNLEEAYGTLEDANEKKRRLLSPLRMNIVMSQLGDICRRISHDEGVNVNDDLEPVEPRPFASRQEEIDAFGHTFANLIMLAQNRDISPQELEAGFNHAMESLTDRDWKASEAAEDGSIVGTPVGDATQRSIGGFVQTPDDIDDGFIIRGPTILLCEHFRPEHMRYVEDGRRGILTDHGGMTSHAAKVARERDIAAIVGTGNATEKLDSGDYVQMDMKTGEVEVQEGR